MKDFREARLAVWYLANPLEPRLVGTARLDGGGLRCLLELDDGWQADGFELSPGLDQAVKAHAPARGMAAPGALGDAMPDQWGKRMIGIVRRQAGANPLDLLLHAGDRRFGALGVSASLEAYVPVEEPPLIRAASLGEAEMLVSKVLDGDPLDERERRLVSSSVAMGGAQPKMLVEHEGEEWIAKFPKGGNVDQPLIEHASMELARRAGIDVASSAVFPTAGGHVLAVRRFDRAGPLRIHAVSARTMLAAEGCDSYASIAAAIGRHCPPAKVRQTQRELFRRMAFNVMMDNTDDHGQNHAFLFPGDGSWKLSPAYDIPPQMDGSGRQALQVSPDPAWRDDFGIGHAMAAAGHFGMSADEARQEWNEVAGWTGEWRAVFAECGVAADDMDYLGEFLDSEAMLAHRKDAVRPGLAAALAS